MSKHSSSSNSKAVDHTKLGKYYKSRVHSGSIIIVRPLLSHESVSTNHGYNYKVLLMKRSPNLIFGGFYAFSGGKVETQDLFDTWLEQYPEMFQRMD